MLCQFHTIISAQIQTQEYTNYINQWQGICYSFTPITAALNMKHENSFKDMHVYVFIFTVFKVTGTYLLFAFSESSSVINLVFSS